MKGRALQRQTSYTVTSWRVKGQTVKQQCNPVFPVLINREGWFFSGNENKTLGKKPQVSFLKPLRTQWNQWMPLILLLYSNSPRTASSRPPIFKQTDKYWFLTPTAKDFLGSSQKTHVCGMSFASWLKSAPAGSFLLLKRQARRGSLDSSKAPSGIQCSHSFLKTPGLPKTWVTRQGQKGN